MTNVVSTSAGGLSAMRRGQVRIRTAAARSERREQVLDRVDRLVRGMGGRRPAPVVRPGQLDPALGAGLALQRPVAPRQPDRRRRRQRGSRRRRRPGGGRAELGRRNARGRRADLPKGAPGAAPDPGRAPPGSGAPARDRAATVDPGNGLRAKSGQADRPRSLKPNTAPVFRRSGIPRIFFMPLLWPAPFLYSLLLVSLSNSG